MESLVVPLLVGGRILFQAVLDGAAQGDVLEHRDGVWSAAPEETKRRKARAALLLQQILERENAPGNGGSE